MYLGPGYKLTLLEWAGAPCESLPSVSAAFGISSRCVSNPSSLLGLFQVLR
jgi:hypothetical protein